MPKSRLAPLIAVIALAALSFPDARAATKGAHYIDLTDNFSRLFDETAQMDEASRVAKFRAQMDALLPGFYAPRNGATPAHYDTVVASALAEFPDLRPRYEQLQRNFPAAFEAGIQHFRKAFPGFTPSVPVYLLHSLGEMDGGMRELGGKQCMIFGADVIARMHDAHTLTPFLDHELFHVENARYFPECGQVWCALWAEGLATYAAKVMNPGADDRQLLLTSPKPIRAAVDANWPKAACFTRSKLDSSADEDINALLTGGRETGEFPRRFGYYVGLRAAEELGAEYSLADFAKMPPGQAKAALVRALDLLVKKAGGCP
jgi:hypothetical protein